MSPLELPTRDSSVHWYLGIDDQLAEGGQGSADVGADILGLARSNAYAPAGIGGEAALYNLYVDAQWDFGVDLDLQLTPIIDGVAENPLTLTLPSVTEPTREVFELGLVSYYPSMAAPQIATVLRGCWCEFELRTVGAVPAGRLVIEGVELEYEVVLEGNQAANASP